MRVCPKCGGEWIREGYTQKMVCRELRLLDINHDNVDYDEADEYVIGDVISYVCMTCGHLFKGNIIEEVWEEMIDVSKFQFKRR